MNVAFTDHGSTQQSAYGVAAPRIVVATDPAQTGLSQLVSAPAPNRLYVAAFQGQQRTGGYAIEVLRIERDGDRLLVQSRFTVPPPDALTIQVLTSPAHLVSIERQSAAGAREAVLFDQSGAERARATVPQSPT